MSNLSLLTSFTPKSLSDKGVFRNSNINNSISFRENLPAV